MDKFEIKHSIATTPPPELCCVSVRRKYMDRRVKMTDSKKPYLT